MGTFQNYYYRLISLILGCVFITLSVLFFCFSMRLIIPSIWGVRQNFFWKIAATIAILVAGILMFGLSLGIYHLKPRIVELLINITHLPILYSLIDHDRSAILLLTLSSREGRVAILREMETTCAWSILKVIRVKNSGEYRLIARNLNSDKLMSFLKLESVGERRVIAKEVGIPMFYQPNEDKDDHYTSCYAQDYDKSTLGLVEGDGEIDYYDELIDMLQAIKADVTCLHRYDHPLNSIAMLNKLSNRSQNMLLFRALKTGDDDTKEVAKYLLKKKYPESEGTNGFDRIISAEESAEIDGCLQAFTEVSTKSAASHNIQERIDSVLSKVCEEFDNLTIEKAYWVLLPHGNENIPIWRPAMNTGNEMMADGSNSPLHVAYHPDKKEIYELLTIMRRSDAILHVHNHPKFIGESDSAASASTADFEFAKYWKSVRPELSSKMSFYVVQNNRVHRYC